MRALISQFARFGVVGLVGLAVDAGIFNVLRLTAFSPEAVHNGPLWAKLISTSIAIIVNWLGNRYWTFRHQRRAHWVREGIEFVLVSIGGLLIAEACLWFSEYVLGLHSLLADNIATNVVGLVLGTAFRFFFYRFWVYGPTRSAAPTQETGAPDLERIPTPRG
ncbi:MAG TPA: GtrA family protein [Galbitalea sp.]|jgi:putative flippase GtrA|nr:GtrA family protein [Galbitalea sp.]